MEDRSYLVAILNTEIPLWIVLVFVFTTFAFLAVWGPKR
jgi:hypothetical protein